MQSKGRDFRCLARTATCALLLVPIGCKQKERPTDVSAPDARNSAAHTSPSSSDSGQDQPTSKLPPLTPLPVASHAYQHGVWASCADGYHISSEPRRDVTRLAYLCAPYQGMQRHGRTGFHRLKAGGDESFDTTLQQGQCARVFAVSDTPEAIVRITVSAPSGEVVARARSREGFVIVNEQGAFCVREPGAYSVNVEAERGAGRLAVEVWTLPSR